MLPVLCAALLLSAAPPAKGEPVESKAIRVAKALDVRSFEPTLPSRQMVDWFREAVGPKKATFEWSDIICGLIKGGTPESPTCVRAGARWDAGDVTIVAIVDLQVGTVASRVSGKPRLDSVHVEILPHSPPDFDRLFDFLRGASLRELLSLLEEATVRARRVSRESTSNESLQKAVRTRMSDDKILEYGKAIDVSRLDRSLPAEPLGSWLFGIVGPRADYLVWSVIDCGTPMDPPPETPRCLRAEAKWRQDGAAVVVRVDVRVTARGDSPLTETPELFEIVVRTVARAGASDAESDALFHTWDAQRLGELEGLLEQAAVQARGGASAVPKGTK